MSPKITTHRSLGGKQKMLSGEALIAQIVAEQQEQDKPLMKYIYRCVGVGVAFCRCCQRRTRHVRACGSSWCERCRQRLILE